MYFNASFKFLTLFEKKKKILKIHIHYQNIEVKLSNIFNFSLHSLPSYVYKNRKS